jgi:hypothetical protein
MEIVQRYSESLQNRASSSPVDFSKLQTRLETFIERPYRIQSLDFFYADSLSLKNELSDYEPISMEELHDVLLVESLIAFTLIDDLRTYERKMFGSIKDSRTVDDLLETFLKKKTMDSIAFSQSQHGGVAGIDHMIAVILIEIITDIGHYGGLYQRNVEMKLTNQSIMVTKIDKNIIRALLKKTKERFISYFNRDGKVLLSKAPTLRQMLRVEYPTVIERNIPVEKLQFYKRLMGESTTATIQYTYGDLVFDILIKSNVHEDTIQRVATQRLGRSASRTMGAISTSTSASSSSSPLSKFFNMIKRKTPGKIHPLPAMEVYRDVSASASSPQEPTQQAGAKKRKYIKKIK